MNILYVCGHDPRETSFGGPQRTHLLWEALRKVGSVYTICYYPDEGKITSNITAVKIIQPTGIRSYPNRVLRRIWDYFDLDGKKLLPVPCKFSIKDPYPGIKFDVVVCRYVDPAMFFHLWNIAPLYIDIDDHPIETFNTRDKLRLKPWQRPMAFLLQKLTFKLLEKKTSGGWIANPNQISWCHFKRPVTVLKNIPQFPPADYDANAPRKNYIFSIGFMQYQPNYMGIDKFVNEIWPSVHKEYPWLQYFIGGKNAPKGYADKWNSTPGVKYLGFVNNLDALYEYCLATVVPIDQGSGTCIKTLESLAYSRVCLARPFGARGLEREATNGFNGLHIFQNAKEFLSQLEGKVLNQKTRYRQETAACQFIHTYYSKDVFFETVEKAFIQM